MKKLFILLSVGLLSQSLFAAANPNFEKIGEANGKVTVTRTWVEKNPDGTFKYMMDIPCKMDVKIPIYRAQKQAEPPREASEVKMPDMSNVDIKELTVGTCKTSYHTGEPLELSIISSLMHVYDKNNIPADKIFSAATTYPVSPKKDPGVFSVFSTKDFSLKNGGLVLTGTKSNVEDIYKESFFGVAVEFQE